MTESSSIISSKDENYEKSLNKVDAHEQQQELQKIAINSFSNTQSERKVQDSNIDEKQQQMEIDTNDMEKKKSNKKKTKKKKLDSEKENISVVS